MEVFCRITLSLLAFLTPALASAEVRIENRQGAQIDLASLHFNEENGQAVPLDRYFHHGRPVLLAPVYYGCPGPCTLLLNNLVASLKRVEASAGHGYEVVAVSIDPSEKPALALSKKSSYLQAYARPGTEAGWHFLTGDADAIARLTAALGFVYERDPRSGAFAHPSAIYVLTDQGVISREIGGTVFPRTILIPALYAASRGRIQAIFDEIREICASYLPHRGWLRSFL